MRKQEVTLEPIELAQEIVDAITAKMGSDVLLLDLTEVTVIADYFVIATADTERQIRAIVEDTREQLKREHDLLPLSIEGSANSGWVLMDYGSVIIHLFSPRQRDYYQLEELWSNARTVVRIA
ncbi:MAG TPA: ribosome silencing factor [Chloroflexi bacterium]|jgi:ribosome-associated protein|nr:ribosome silencing factor [Chloroflexota bacterium]